MVVEKMVESVLDMEPRFKSILEDPLEIESTPEYSFFASHYIDNPLSHSRDFLREFDESLQGKTSRLIDYKKNAEKTLSDAVRAVLGVTHSVLSDKEAIRLALDPSRNRLYGEALNLSTMSKLMRTLFHPSYTFRKRISHTADSQDQRHRMIPASRPCLHRHITDEPDYITPALIRQDSEIEKLFDTTMEQSWEAIVRLKQSGVSDEFAMYLLPNAVAIRTTESGDLLNLRHKYAMRLCYNAQEEIWRASVEEVEQIRRINPMIGEYLLPPCTLRHMARMLPVCPEGERFCGVKVWKLDIDRYERII